VGAERWLCGGCGACGLGERLPLQKIIYTGRTPRDRPFGMVHQGSQDKAECEALPSYVEALPS